MELIDFQFDLLGFTGFLIPFYDLWSVITEFNVGSQHDFVDLLGLYLFNFNLTDWSSLTRVSQYFTGFYRVSRT